VQPSIQSQREPSRLTAAEAALMRWYPNATLHLFDVLREEAPSWPIVPVTNAAGGNADAAEQSPAQYIVMGVSA
jgi:hypothetical protein